MEKISVIIPVYNVEKYIRKCLESVLEQTFSGLEIIIIDDGSTDESGNICDFYAKQDQRIHVFHNVNNQGLAAARNRGVREASAKYIGFVDSDDYISKNMFQELLYIIEKDNGDIAICGYNVCGNREESVKLKEKIYNRNEATTLLLKNKIHSFVWNKLFKKDLFQGLYFAEGKCYEDVRIMSKLFLNANRIICTSKCLYYYNVRENSITGNTRYEKSWEYVESLEQRCMDLLNTNYMDAAAYGEFVCLRRLVYEMIINKEIKNDYYKRLIQITKKRYIDAKRVCSVWEKMVANIYMISPKIYACVRLLISRLFHR